MSNTANKKMANRCGLDLKIYDYVPSGDISSSDVKYTIDFANEVSIELSSDMVWATGGKEHNKLVGFNNAIEGTLKISTQMVTTELIALISGHQDGATVVFKNSSDAPKSYIIVGETVWVDEEGTSHSEKITIYKASAKRSYNVTYNGDGDPQSLDVEFELGANADNMVMDVLRGEEESEVPEEPETPVENPEDGGES